MENIHTIAMSIMMTFILLLASAALFHHFVLKDGILLKMLGKNSTLYYFLVVTDASLDNIFLAQEYDRY